MSVPVALYTLGQTPRPDLVPPMVAALNTPDVRVLGVLDGLEATDIRGHELGNYPLKTRLADGTEVSTDCQFLQPRLQALIDAEEEEVVMHIVLSVAPFQSLHAEGILIRPFEHGCRVLAANHVHEICVVVPYREQVFYSGQKWEAAGFSACVMCVEDRPGEVPVDEWLASCATGRGAEGIVIDFVGYSKALTTNLEKSLNIPVYDLGFEAMAFGRSVLEEYDRIVTAS